MRLDHQAEVMSNHISSHPPLESPAHDVATPSEVVVLYSSRSNRIEYTLTLVQLRLKTFGLLRSVRCGIGGTSFFSLS